jgi:hypothetical protein
MNTRTAATGRTAHAAAARNKTLSMLLAGWCFWRRGAREVKHNAGAADAGRSGQSAAGTLVSQDARAPLRPRQPDCYLTIFSVDTEGRTAPLPGAA